MKKYFVCSFIQVLFVFSSVSAQERTFSTIEDVINYHIEELRANGGKYDNLFVLISADSSIKLPDKVIVVNCFLDAKLLNKKDKNYAVRFILSSVKESIQIQAINFQIIRHSRKRIEWVNLGNGGKYKIDNHL